GRCAHRIERGTAGLAFSAHAFDVVDGFLADHEAECCGPSQQVDRSHHVELLPQIALSSSTSSVRGPRNSERCRHYQSSCSSPVTSSKSVAREEASLTVWCQTR